MNSSLPALLVRLGMWTTLPSEENQKSRKDIVRENEAECKIGAIIVGNLRQPRRCPGRLQIIILVRQFKSKKRTQLHCKTRNESRPSAAANGSPQMQARIRRPLLAPQAPIPRVNG